MLSATRLLSRSTQHTRVQAHSFYDLSLSPPLSLCLSVCLSPHPPSPHPLSLNLHKIQHTDYDKQHGGSEQTPTGMNIQPTARYTSAPLTDGNTHRSVIHMQHTTASSTVFNRPTAHDLCTAANNTRSMYCKQKTTHVHLTAHSRQTAGVACFAVVFALLTVLVF